MRQVGRRRGWVSVSPVRGREPSWGFKKPGDCCSDGLRKGAACGSGWMKVAFTCGFGG